jgi:hypothetical protein
VPASQLTLPLQPGPHAPQQQPPQQQQEQQQQQQQQQQAASMLDSSYMSDGTGFDHIPKTERAAAAVMTAYLQVAPAAYAAASAQVSGEF